MRRWCAKKTSSCTWPIIAFWHMECVVADRGALAKGLTPQAAFLGSTAGPAAGFCWGRRHIVSAGLAIGHSVGCWGLCVGLCVVVAVDTDKASSTLYSTPKIAKDTRSFAERVCGKLGHICAERSAWCAELVLRACSVAKETACALD